MLLRIIQLFGWNVLGRMVGWFSAIFIFALVGSCAMGIQ